MEAFPHIRIILGMILSLSLATLLKAAVKFIQHPHRTKPYWIHLLYAFFIFLELLLFWWWERKLAGIPHWTFPAYFFTVCYIMTFYGLTSLLFPDDIKDYDGYEDYFFSRRKWFFGLLAITNVLDIADTLLKGLEHFYSLNYPYYLATNAADIALCIIAMKSSSRRFHAFLIIWLILFKLIDIGRIYFYW